MIVRRETAADRAAVEAVVSAAFGEDPPEVGLLRALRADAGWIPALSLVALREDEVVGHVVCTRGWVGEFGGLGLGPISVLPTYQGQGVGSALMHAVIAAAEAMGEPLIALLGDPAFYGRFGFAPAAQAGIAAPDPAWGAHFQARLLSDCPAGVGGTFRYAAPFADL